MKNYDYIKSTQSTINFAQLLKSKNLKNLSLGAKAVYSLLLDALNKSGHLDKLGHAFIVYPIKTIMSDLNISKQTAINYLNELTKEGLITKFKRGLGMASLIYPMDCGFAAKSNTKITDESSGQELTTSKVKKLDPYNDIYLHTSYNLKFNNNINKSNLIKSDVMDDKSDYDTAFNDFTKQINAISLKKNHPEEAEIIDGMVEILTETFMINSKKMVVCGKSLPTEIVKGRLLRLGEEHIEYVLECLNKNTSKIKNIKKYLLAALFNAPATLMSYKQNKESQKTSGTKEKKSIQDKCMQKNAFFNCMEREVDCEQIEKWLLTKPLKKQMA
jgi:DNA-binding Lrp family transcriptional regulator